MKRKVSIQTGRSDTSAPRGRSRNGVPWALRAVVFLVGCLSTQAGQTWTSSAAQTALVELFTSEGCSSCPPADRWLGGLTQHPQLWTEFVPVAFHVNYWDNLGWKDRFATPEFTHRQRAYVAFWGGQTLYTPGFVVNGRERGSIGGTGLLMPSRESPGVLRVEQAEENRFILRFTPQDGLDGPLEGHLAILDCGVNVQVERGENAGRALRHDFVVRSLASEALNPSGRETTGSITLPTVPLEKGARRAVAAWVTRRGSPVPLQATGGWLVE